MVLNEESDDESEIRIIDESDEENDDIDDDSEDIEDESDDSGLEDNEGLERFTENLAKEFTKNIFPLIWSEEKQELKEMKRKDACEEMFFRGAVEMLYSYIKENEELEKELDKEPDELWDDGGFIKSMSPEEVELKKRTLVMGHDEEMDYNCKVCGTSISAHNNDWHDNMCDKCFNSKYHPNL